MTGSSSEMLRSVTVDDRGQLVIPEEMLSELGLEGGSVLVLVKRGNEIVLRREKDVLAELDDKCSTSRLLKRAWDEEDDDVWDEHFEPADG